MQMRKALISFLLILSYSFGFAHNLVPHCTEFHIEHADEIHEHHDDHHDHEVGEIIDDDHSHVVHNDHYDDNLLDYFLCALEDVNHHDDGCNLECYTQIPEFNGSEKSADKSLDHFDFQSCFVSLERTSSESNYTDVSVLHLSEESTAQCPYRGPPSHNS
jgi:hypothetical protein